MRPALFFMEFFIMSWLSDFGKQAAQDALDLGVSLGNREINGLPTTTPASLPGAAPTVAGQPAAGVVASDPRNDLGDDPNANFVVFGQPVNKTSVYVATGALTLALILKLARG